MDFDTIADELYVLAPDEFISARNDRAKQARGDQDRALAERISALRKPTMAAWVTNALVRSSVDEVELLLELGRELREVLADIEGDELRELTRQRYQLVSALVQQARSLAQSRGRRVTDEVAQSVRTTLEATLSDEASARAVAGGRLTDALEVSGFSTAPQGVSRPRLARSTSGSSSDAGVADLEVVRQRRARIQAERDVDAADKAAQRARIAAQRAEQRLENAEHDTQESSAAVDRFRTQLEEATADLDKRAQQEREARADSDEAQQRVRETEEELERARAQLEQLPD